MVREYFFLYLIYGFSMINMGVYSIKQKDIKVSNLHLVKSLKYLGYFAVTHGISEWLTMVNYISLYPDSYMYLYEINEVIKAGSFAFLMYFGLDLLHSMGKVKKWVLKIPVALLLIHFLGFVALIIEHGVDYHFLNQKFDYVIMRYVMALSSGMITAAALYLNAGLIEETISVKMAGRYKSLTWTFLIYGVLEGAFVRKAQFFPANIINWDLFVNIFRFPALAIKAVVGLVINFLLVKVIDTFSWEQEEKLKRFEERRIVDRERRKLGMEIHDSIIQGLYAAGLKIEYLINSKQCGKLEESLEKVKSDLNNTIDRTREFLSSTSIQTIELEDLRDSLQLLIQKYNKSQDIKINMKYEVSPLSVGQLSPDKSTQIYYIIQEAVSNVVKHSKADHADILVEARCDFLYISIIDNGKGISFEELESKKHLGIISMQERAKQADGLLNINKSNGGTCVELMIPWGEP